VRSQQGIFQPVSQILETLLGGEEKNETHRSVCVRSLCPYPRRLCTCTDASAHRRATDGGTQTHRTAQTHNGSRRRITRLDARSKSVATPLIHHSNPSTTRKKSLVLMLIWSMKSARKSIAKPLLSPPILTAC
jgi:hypothetical protein